MAVTETLAMVKSMKMVKMVALGIGVVAMVVILKLLRIVRIVLSCHLEYSPHPMFNQVQPISLQNRKKYGFWS